MKKEYKAPEMDVIEMEYKPDCLLCESGQNCDEVPAGNPFGPNLPSTTGPLG